MFDQSPPQNQIVTRPTWKTDFFKSWWYFTPLRSWHLNVDQGNILIYKKGRFLLANEFASSYFICCLLLADRRQMHSNHISACPRDVHADEIPSMTFNP